MYIYRQPYKSIEAEQKIHDNKPYLKTNKKRSITQTRAQIFIQMNLRYI